MENKWQPIETAPKDGTEILVFANGDYTIASYFISEPQRDTYLKWNGKDFEVAPNPNAVNMETDQYRPGTKVLFAREAPAEPVIPIELVRLNAVPATKLAVEEVERVLVPIAVVVRPVIAPVS